MQGGGACAPSPPSLLDIFFYKSKVHEQKLVLGEYEVYSQNAGKGHFRDTNFQNISGGIPPDPPGKLAHRALVLPPPPPPTPVLKSWICPCLMLVIYATAGLNVSYNTEGNSFLIVLELFLCVTSVNWNAKKKCHHAAFYLWFLKLKA